MFNVKKPWIFLVLLILFANFLFANHLIDSLSQSLKDETNLQKKGQILLQILNHKDLKPSLEFDNYKNTAFQIARDENDINLLDSIYIICGDKYFNAGQVEKALSFYGKYEEEMIGLNNLSGVAKALFLQGRLQLETVEFEKAVTLIKRSQEIYQSLENKNVELAGVKNILANHYRDKGDYNKAKSLYIEAIKLVEDEKFAELNSKILSDYGRLFRKQSKYDSARIYYQKALELNQITGNKRGQSGTYNNLGNIYHVEGNLEKALEMYITSLNIKQELGYARGIAISHHNIGAVRIDLEDYKLAKIDFEKSNKIAKEIEYKFLLVHNFLKLGIVSRALGNIPKAIELHKQCIRDSEALNFEQGVIEGTAYLAEDYFELKDYGNALEKYEDCLVMAEKNNRKNYISLCLVQIAACFTEIQKLTQEGNDISTNSRYSDEKIESLLLRGTAIAKEIDAVENMTPSFVGLINFYNRKKNYAKEAEVSRQYISYRDSLFENQRAASIAEWTTKYETTEKEKEIVILQKEKEIQKEQAINSRNKFIAGILLLLAGAIGAIGFFQQQNKVKRTKQIESLRTKISSDLHDDVGSLLSGLSMQAELLQMSLPEADQPRVQKISNLGRSAMSRMRDAVWAMDARKDKFSDLLDRMREFAEETLVQAEIPYSLNFKGIDEGKFILPNIRQNVYLIFKEALTNIIKHADPSIVVIELENAKDFFTMSIQNDGLKTEKTYKTSGLGTSNMKMRAEHINGNLDIKREKGFEVILKSPSLT